MGNDLAKKLYTYSGLDESFFDSEFKNLLKKYGKADSEITLTELREILALEVQELLLDFKKKSEDFSQSSN